MNRLVKYMWIMTEYSVPYFFSMWKIFQTQPLSARFRCGVLSPYLPVTVVEN
jgi:hypothetical protein